MEAFEERAAQYDKEYSLASERLERFEKSISSDNCWIKLFKRFKKAERLSEEMVDCLIDRVELYEGQVIKVIFKFQDVFEYTRDFFGRSGLL